jgi:hypothetical protein
MIKEVVDRRKWVSTAVDKLTAYLNRVPFSVNYAIENSRIIITPDVENAQEIPVDFDYNLEPKAWVHKIKEELIPYYPRLIESIYEEVELSAEELALRLVNGEDPQNIPRVEKRLVKMNGYRIDKVLCYKDIFLLELESEATKFGHGEKADFRPVEPRMFRYKYVGSSVIFLNKLKERKVDIITASDEFFKRAVLIDEVEVKSK